MTTPALLLFITLALGVALPDTAAANSAQSRDHLTEQEVDLVKDTQILDKRVEVFLKAIERRLMVITGTSAFSEKQLKKDSETWGALPTGTRAELIGDIAKILDEAITNIDDVSARDAKNPLIPKALRELAAETTRAVEALRPLAPQAQGESEIASFEQLTENAGPILEAAKKLPPPIDKKEKAKSDKSKAKN
ncbi:MAG: hypothetical protein ABJB97_02125 [Acidobacteriota bacterium]